MYSAVMVFVVRVYGGGDAVAGDVRGGVDGGGDDDCV